MHFVVKEFKELLPVEIYQIFKARVNVFVVEQNCIYHEIDDYDPISYHVFLIDNNELLAYCRVLPPNTTFKTPSIGRVIALKRHQGYATKVVKIAIQTALENYDADTITIEAQTYARSLYEKLGFKQTSQPFLEDGIEHIQMQYKKPIID